MKTSHSPPIYSYISEMVEDRWVGLHAARRLTSIKFSFDPCNIYRDGPGVVGYPADARSVGDSHPSCFTTVIGYASLHHRRSSGRTYASLEQSPILRHFTAVTDRIQPELKTVLFNRSYSESFVCLTVLTSFCANILFFSLTVQCPSSLLT